MSEVNISMHGLDCFPDEHKAIFRKVLSAIDKADGSFDIESLSRKIKSSDDTFLQYAIVTLESHGLIVKDGGRFGILDRGRYALASPSW